MQVLVFTSKIKFYLTLQKKKKNTVTFMLLFTIMKLIPTLLLTHQKTYFLAISRQFGLVQRAWGGDFGWRGGGGGV